MATASASDLSALMVNPLSEAVVPVVAALPVVAVAPVAAAPWSSPMPFDVPTSVIFCETARRQETSVSQPVCRAHVTTMRGQEKSASNVDELECVVGASTFVLSTMSWDSPTSRDDAGDVQ